MEIIKKVISLEEYKNRFNYNPSHIDGDDTTTETINNWGKIPYDFYFKTLDECKFSKIKDNIPLVKGFDISSTSDNVNVVNNCFRYKCMVYWYNWLNEYGKMCKYYKLCKRNTDYIWVEVKGIKGEGDFFKENYNLGVNILPSVPDVPKTNRGYNVGDIIEVNSEAILFKQIFRIDDDNTRYELLLLNFIREYFEGNYINKDNLSIPFIDIPLHITQNIDNLGVLSSSALEWNPRKKYVVGDIVIYKQKHYILSSGDSYDMIEITGGLYETFLSYIKNGGDNSLYYSFIVKENLNKNDEPSKIVYDGETGRKNIYYEVKNDITNIFFPQLTHKAQMDLNGNEFIFDTNLWVASTLNKDSEINDGSGIAFSDLIYDINGNQYIHTVSESRLTSLKRRKISVDEDGNKLPFVLDQWSSMDTEFPYNVGVFNIQLGSNDIIRGDVMKEITFSEQNDSLQIIYNTNGKTLIYRYITREYTDNIENEIKLNNNITLKIDKEKSSYEYRWKIINSSMTMYENVELIDYLPSAEDKYYGKKYQITSLTENILYYTIYECEREKMNLVYAGEADYTVFITPSLIKVRDDAYQSGGTITFIYLKDCFLKPSENGSVKEYDDETGLMYVETYSYDVNIAAINLVSDEKYEIKNTHIYRLYDYELGDNEEIYEVIDENANIYQSENVGKIYGIRAYDGSINRYVRLLSEYIYIDVNFDRAINEVTSTDNSNLKKNVLLSNLYYNFENIKNDDFQNDYVFKNEYSIGFENVIEDVNIDIDRGLTSSFEKHHILCEIKSLSDLENYRNNLFKI